MKMSAVDHLARVLDVFGNPSFDVFLFAKPLDPAVKTELAAQPSLTFGQIAAKTGQTPLLNLQFFFDPSANRCIAGKLMSYTAVMLKSETFPFEAGSDTPINFSTDRVEGGVSEVSCQFTTGAPFRVRVRHSVTADKQVLPALLPPGKDRLVFSWDIDLSGEVAKGR